MDIKIFRMSDMRLIVMSIIMLFSTVVVPNSFATNSDVSEEVSEAVSAIGEYSVEQKDKALKKAKEAMNSLDKRIETIEIKMETDWDSIQQSTREKYSASLRSLRKQRNELSEWYGSLINSSKDAWGETRKGFASAYDSLESAWNKIEKDFSNESEP